MTSSPSSMAGSATKGEVGSTFRAASIFRASIDADKRLISAAVGSAGPPSESPPELRLSRLSALTSDMSRSGSLSSGGRELSEALLRIDMADLVEVFQ